MSSLNKRKLSCSYKLLALCLASILSGHSYAKSSDYDSLIIAARNGNTKPALEYFDTKKTLTHQQIADWLQIASWAGNDPLVIYVHERYRNEALPLRAYPAIAKAYRNQKRWSESLQIWKYLCDKEPNNPDYQRGYLLTLGDSGDYKSAISQTNNLIKKHPDSRNYLVAAYLYRLAGQQQDELFATTMAMQLSGSAGGNAEEYVRALKDNNLSNVLMKDQSTKNDPEARANYAAELVRLAFVPNRSEAERYEIADRALASYQTMLSEWQNKKEFEPYYRRIVMDQLGALLARDRHKDVIQQKTMLEKQGYTIPEYARYWVAAAYMHEKKPKQAESLLNDVFYDHKLLKNGVTEDQKSDLFYSHLESGNYKSAYLLTHNILKNTPSHRYMPGSPLPLPNTEWLQGNLFLAELHQYANNLPAAEKLLRTLKDKAPANQSLKIDYAKVLMARGWPRKAEKELKKAELLEPTNIELEIEQSYNALELQEWRQAELLLADVEKRAPENLAVKELKRAHDIHNSAELRMGASMDLNSNSPDAKNRDSTFNTAIYSPPLAKNWRVFAGYGQTLNHFSEGKGNVHDWSTGVEWRSRDLWMEGELSNRHFEHDDKLGARFSASYDLGDTFSVGTNVERISRNTPTRALKHGITANSAEVNAQWKPNEKRNVDLSYSRTNFTDGNLRSEFSLTGEQNIWSSHKTQVNLQAGMYYGANKDLDAPYYNPRKTVDVLPAVNVNNIIYENYSTKLSQQVTAGVGNAWEKKHGNGLITQVGYGQRFEWNDKGSVGANLNWVKRPYDGKREHNLAVGLDMTLRF